MRFSNYSKNTFNTLQHKNTTYNGTYKGTYKGTSSYQ